MNSKQIIHKWRFFSWLPGEMKLIGVYCFAYQSFLLLVTYETGSWFEITWKQKKWRVKNTFHLKLVAGWRREQISMLEASRTLTLYVHFGNSQVDSPQIFASCWHCIAHSCSASWGTWKENRSWGVGDDAPPKQWTWLHYFLIPDHVIFTI